MRKLLVGAGVAVIVLLVVVGVMVARALALESLQPTEQAPVAIEVDRDAIATRLSGAIAHRTISGADPTAIDAEAFLALHEYLRTSYPLVHEHLVVEKVSDFSLLLTWQGLDPGLAPGVLMGHLDTVPVIPGTEDNWAYPPFEGRIADGYVWGRGALDDKVSVILTLEAVEHLLAEGFTPRRTFYLAFGHDEEVGGFNGAGPIARTLEGRGVDELAFVLDEGGVIVDGMAWDISGSVALIGIAEKGFLSLVLRVEGNGGHSSTPPANTNIGILAEAISRLEGNPFPAHIDGVTAAMFEFLGPEMPLVRRAVVANLWLTEPLVTRSMTGEPPTAAMLRTTTAATMINAGVKDNVLPIEARAVVNFRIIPGDTRETVIERVREVIDDDRIEVEPLNPGSDPSPVSDARSPAFEMLGRTLRQIVGSDVLIAPYLVVGGTDAKYYSGRSTSVFRFLPVKFEAGDLERLHGTDERIAIESLGIGARYLIQLIRNSDELQ